MFQLYGNPIDYLVVFIAGVATSFTPCIYPLLPITLAVIGGEQIGSRFKGLALSLVYVLGLAITYSVLGVIAVSTGKIFGYFLETPLVNLVIGVVCIFGGLWIIGVFKLRFPATFTSPLKKREGLLGAFVMGIFSGLAVSPCVTPIMASILAITSQKKNLIHGATLLFVYAYGMGFVLIIAGTFSAFLAYLPKSGKWLNILKIIYGVVLITIGGYFILKCINLILN
jgi:thiol:disulfide interchange protein DsbD